MSDLAPLYGLVLAGGRSRRMGRDKAALDYHGRPQVEVVRDLLTPRCARVFLSVRAGDAEAYASRGIACIEDAVEDRGPAGGLWSAMRAFPEAAWLVVACDLPFLRAEVLDRLIAARGPDDEALAYASAEDGLPEPVCAIYEPAFRPRLEAFVCDDLWCPRKMLIRTGARLLTLEHGNPLANVNRPEEYEAARQALAVATDAKEVAAKPLAGSATCGAKVRLRYYAALREQAGSEQESLETTASTFLDLYQELAARHGFRLPPDRIRVAADGQFVSMADRIPDGAEIVFIPPVAGG